MSIENQHKFYIPVCDICGEELDGEFDFYDAVASKKQNGWKSKRENGKWIDTCTQCQKSDKQIIQEYFSNEVEPIKIGNTNTKGKCGMCGINVPTLYPHKVGKVDFMICEMCKGVMSL